MNFVPFSEEFVRHGGKMAFGVPGGGPSLALVDALAKQGAEFITTGHETTAALMAGAVARQTGAPSLAVTIKGPGFANLAPGLLANAYEGFPMLSVSEAYDTTKPGPRRHKWLDHARMGGEFLKCCRNFSPSPEFFAACLSMARTEFPGPVQVDLVESVASPDTPLPPAPGMTRGKSSPPCAPPSDLRSWSARWVCARFGAASSRRSESRLSPRPPPRD